MSEDTLIILGWVGSFMSIVGSIVLSLNIKESKYAYVIWLAGSFPLLIVLYYANQEGLILREISFFIINIIGVYNWVIKPKSDSLP